MEEEGERRTLLLDRRRREGGERRMKEQSCTPLPDRAGPARLPSYSGAYRGEAQQKVRKEAWARRRSSTGGSGGATKEVGAGTRWWPSSTRLVLGGTRPVQGRSVQHPRAGWQARRKECRVGQSLRKEARWQKETHPARPFARWMAAICSSKLAPAWNLLSVVSLLAVCPSQMTLSFSFLLARSASS